MKRNILKPFLFVTLLILIVSLACTIDLGGPTKQAPQPIVPVTEAPVIETPAQPQPEQPSPIPPTEAPTAAPVTPFFKEEFDTDVLADWSNFINADDPKSDKSKAKISIANGSLTFDIQDNYLYSYLIYTKQSYKDVRLEVSATNRGKNNNNVSLICRYTKDGWYEFNIASNGMFNIFAFDATGIVHKGYNMVYSGGSNAIKMGKETNVYVAVCSGRDLTLYINGEKSAFVTDKKFGLTDGNVGISVSSFNVYPIIVNIDYFDIQQP